MDSIALVANANHKLNMKQRELIEPDLNPTFLGDSLHVTTWQSYLRELRHGSAHLGKFSLNFSRWSFAFRDNLLYC